MGVGRHPDQAHLGDGFSGRYPEVIATAIACVIAYLIEAFFVWRRRSTPS